MSRPYGPIPITAGIVTYQDIDNGAAWVVIENSSLSFDIGVCFQVNPPPVVTVFSGPPWDGVIQAGGWRKFQLPIGDPFRQWTGRVWLLPVSVSAVSAAVGSVSGYARVYMTTYLPGEEPADAPTIIRALDIVSQPRVITVPATPGPIITGLWDVVATPELHIAGISLTATNKSNDQVVAYLYSYLLLGVGDSGVAWAVDFVIDAAVYDPTATIIRAGPFTFATLRLSAPSAGAGSNILPYYPPQPANNTFSWGAGTDSDTLVLRLKQSAVLGNPFIRYNIIFDIDNQNFTTPGGIGNPGPHVKTGVFNANLY